MAYLRTHRITPVAGDLRDLKGHGVAVNPLGGAWRLGDTVSARIGGAGGVNVSLRVVALLPPTLIGPTFLLPPEFMPAAGPRVYALLTDGTAKIGVSKQAWIRNLQEQQEQTNLRVMLALLGLASLYTVIAIVNAVVISAADRIEEFRTHRVTGLTRGQVVGVALWEALTIAAAGLIIGGIAALSTLLGNTLSIAGMLGFPVFVMPVPVVAGVAAAVTAVVGVTSVLTTLSATRVPREAGREGCHPARRR
ncbi:MAG TPA: FtsX-like permease family protein [Candidatus Limnocylindrales bacterium]|nr:FtsX-like permease family protein [Candidatus Limnocylindrales bacterium]